ncbi:hypothetical protein [Streptosporangium roseum]|uniref:hypothetical protein n=1 Tax=Streptosporangium roseum TaxID=2001 RepID=UPI003332CC9A
MHTPMTSRAVPGPEGMALAKKNGRLKGKQPKMPETARRSIRRRYAQGEVSLADLATEYSVGRSTIHRIVHGQADGKTPWPVRTPTGAGELA